MRKSAAGPRWIEKAGQNRYNAGSMDTLKVHIKSFGCQMNKLDSELVSSALAQRGLQLTDKVTAADVIIINTCSVRDHAEQRVLSNIGHISHLKKKRPDLLLAIIGCMAQRLGDRLAENEAVDIVCGPGQIPLLPGLIEEALTKQEKKIAVAGDIRQGATREERQRLDSFEYTYDTAPQQTPNQAFVRVMRGCNNFCSYCIVPYVRGPEISRPASEIVSQVRKLADSGVRQVTLLGQNVNAYHDEPDQGPIQGLGELLGQVSEINGIEWVRFITSHPGKFEDSILDVMASNKKICPYLHVPAQSGSNTILERMNRGYTREHYFELIDRAREAVPGIAIAGDFIVGFPGESESDFKDTCDLIRRVRYKNCFVFKYSPRPGTDSDQSMADTIPAEIKQERNIRLLEIQNKISEEENLRFENRKFTVLVEGLSKKPHLNRAQHEDMPQLIGRTADDYIVVFNGPESLAGTFTDVEIEKTSALTLFGKWNGA